MTMGRGGAQDAPVGPAGMTADNEDGIALPEDTEDLSIVSRLVGLDYSFPAETNKERMLPGTDQALRQAQDSFRAEPKDDKEPINTLVKAEGPGAERRKNSCSPLVSSRLAPFNLGRRPGPEERGVGWPDYHGRERRPEKGRGECQQRLSGEWRKIATPSSP